MFSFLTIAACAAEPAASVATVQATTPFPLPSLHLIETFTFGSSSFSESFPPTDCILKGTLTGTSIQAY